MTDIHAVKAAAATILSASVWAPIVSALPEHIPLVAMSGFCGGLARWILLRERLWPDGLGTLVLGVISAVFLWPIGQPLLEPIVGNLDMEPTTAVMFGGLVTGLMGVSILGFILDIGRKRAGETEETDD